MKVGYLMKLFFDFDFALQNPDKFKDIPIFIDYGTYSREGILLDFFPHSITYRYYDYINNVEKIGRILRTNFNRVFLLSPINN